MSMILVNVKAVWQYLILSTVLSYCSSQIDNEFTALEMFSTAESEQPETSRTNCHRH